MIRVRVKNYKSIIRRIERNNRRLYRKHDYIFRDSLYGFIQVVKEELRKGGPERPASFNHLYTLELYKNTRAESRRVMTGGGYNLHIQVGYFVPYGVHLEEFTPRDVPLARLQDWADKKDIKNVNLPNLRKKLRRNPDFYPILDTTWNDRQYSDLYVQEAIRRVRETWFNA